MKNHVPITAQNPIVLGPPSHAPQAGELPNGTCFVMTGICVASTALNVLSVVIFWIRRAESGSASWNGSTCGLHEGLGRVEAGLIEDDDDDDVLGFGFWREGGREARPNY